MTLKNRILLISALASVLLMAALLGAGYLLQKQNDARADEAILLGKEQLWMKIVDTHLGQLSLGMQGLTQDPALLAALKTGDQAQLRERANDTFELLHDDIFTQLVITDSSGELIYSSVEGVRERADDGLLERALADRKPVRGMQVDERGRPIAAVAVPVSLEGKLIGAIRLASDLHAAIGEFSEYDKARVYVLNLAGDRAVAGDADFQGVLNLRVGANVQTTLTRTLDATTYQVFVLPLADAAQRPIATLVGANDITETAAKRRNAYLSIFTTLLILTPGLLAVASWYLRRAFTPLDTLLNTVRRIDEGDTAARCGIDRNDETGQLGRAFDRMAQTIEEAIERERQNAEDVTGKVELIREVVEGAAHGDLTGQLMVYRDKDMISDLAAGIQGMFDSLNNLVARIQKSGIQVTSSATEIAATAKQQEATVSEQAATTNEIRATVTEISATSRELVNTMHEVTDVALRTAESANQGRTSLTRMEETMHNMMEATSAIGSKLAVLSEKAGNINTVVTTINKVSDQTNLLSLNAAIEAEKAGEYGVGFAVVATEIRRLADQTAVATWDIEQMVKEMQSAVSAGVMGMEKFSTEVKQGVDDVRRVGAQLAHIIEQVEHLIPRFEEVHEGMQSQSKGAVQISEAMVQLSESAQQTAESLRQSNGAISQLNEAARRLQEGVSHFKVNG